MDVGKEWMMWLDEWDTRESKIKNTNVLNVRVACGVPETGQPRWGGAGFGYDHDDPWPQMIP